MAEDLCCCGPVSESALNLCFSSWDSQWSLRWVSSTAEPPGRWARQWRLWWVRFHTQTPTGSRSSSRPEPFEPRSGGWSGTCRTKRRQRDPTERKRITSTYSDHLWTVKPTTWFKYVENKLERFCHFIYRCCNIVSDMIVASHPPRRAWPRSGPRRFQGPGCPSSTACSGRSRRSWRTPAHI